MTHRAGETTGVRVPPPLLYLGPLVLGLVLHRLRPVPLLPRVWLARLLGGVLTGGGVSLLAWSLATMRGAGTPPEPWKPTQRIVMRGPFRYTRNPIYAAFTAISLGVAGLANALWPVLLLPAAVLAIRRGVIDREERYLERQFGEEYLRYKARVRRWL